MAVPPHSPKALLRDELKKRRQAFVSEVNIAAGNAAMADLALARLKGAKVVAAYHAIGTEIDPSALVVALSALGVTIALPHVTRVRDSLRFLAWHPREPLEPGIFGLRQPCADAPEVVPDVILTPLLGFDAALNRIGYGVGHYDRAFARYPAAGRVGLAWRIQACDRIPTDPWDVPLHAIVTEKEWIER
jgi:5-formyltetrahydrofolate cyclo-ligase